MFEVCKVKDLKVETLSSGLAPFTHCFDKLLCGSRSTVLAKLVRFAPNCCCPPLVFVFAPADTDDESR